MIANQTAPPPLPDAESKPPDWFARHKVIREARAAAESARTVDRAQSERQIGPFERLIKWLVGGAAVGYGLSLLFHAVLLAVFSIVALHLGRGGSTISTEVGIADAEHDELLDTRAFEISTGSEGAEVTAVEPLPIDSATPDLRLEEAVTPYLDGIADGAGEDDMTTPGSGSDVAFELPKGGTAVKQGSFAAWTVPADPRVGQDYVIVIEVQLPEGTDRYLKTDLVGQLRGTDGYRINIPDGREWNGLGWMRPRRSPAFHREGDKARIVFFVRGAHEALVRDTIQIRSKLLDEQQTLRIVF